MPSGGKKARKLNKNLLQTLISKLKFYKGIFRDQLEWKVIKLCVPF